MLIATIYSNTIEKKKNVFADFFLLLHKCIFKNPGFGKRPYGTDSPLRGAALFHCVTDEFTVPWCRPCRNVLHVDAAGRLDQMCQCKRSQHCPVLRDLHQIGFVLGGDGQVTVVCRLDRCAEEDVPSMVSPTMASYKGQTLGRTATLRSP